jgi:hypothetical protein
MTFWAKAGWHIMGDKVDILTIIDKDRKIKNALFFMVWVPPSRDEIKKLICLYSKVVAPKLLSVLA